VQHDVVAGVDDRHDFFGRHHRDESAQHSRRANTTSKGHEHRASLRVDR
jgi:hypothetical protein